MTTQRRDDDARSSTAEPSPLDRVSKLWSETTARRTESSVRGWLDAGIVLANCVQEKQTGSSERTWLGALVEDLDLRRDGTWLSLGCGAGATEIAASKAGLFGDMEAFDAASGSIEQAERDATAQGVRNIRFGSKDLNAARLPTAAFDVVMMCMSLHHVEKLEALLDSVSNTLRPGGAFLINEYVGPSQLQYTERQQQTVTHLLAALRHEWKVDLDSGLGKTSYVVQPRAHWSTVDPSEAIRSDEIISRVEERFDIIIRRDYGGTILGPLLENIVHNFDPTDSKDQTVIRLLGSFEDLLISNGLLGSDYTVLAARPRRHGDGPWPAPLQPPVDSRNLEAEVEDLRSKLAERDGLLATIFSSRSWRLMQAIRRALRRA